MGKNNWETAGGLRAPSYRRGIATSISVVLLLAALLFLIVSIAHYSGMVGKSNAMLAQVSGAQEQFDAASFGMRTLSEGYGMKATLLENTTTFTQNLSQQNTYWFQKGMDGWGSFLGPPYGSGNTTMNASFDSREIRIYPQNMSVRNSNGAGCSASGLANVECIFIAPGNDTVKEYGLTVEVDGAPAVSPSSHPACAGNELDLRVTGKGPSGGSDATVCMGAADPPKDVSIISGGMEIATVRLNNTGKLEFDYDPQRNTYLTIVAEMYTKPSYIELWPEITSTSGAVAKQGRVRLE